MGRREAYSYSKPGRREIERVRQWIITTVWVRVHMDCTNEIKQTVVKR